MSETVHASVLTASLARYGAPGPDIFSDRVRHFLLTSVSSIPFLEAVLLLRAAPGRCRYAPRSTELKEIVDDVARLHASHLIEVTHLIHSADHLQARRCACAFDTAKENT